METINFDSPETAMNVAKEAVWLAWQACGGTSGYGFMRDNPNAEKDAVWDQAYNQRDYSVRHGDPERVSCDYVFGRMMKMSFTVKGSAINYHDFTPRPDYQSWCRKYPTFRAVFDAAAKALNTTPLAQAA